MGEIYNEWRSNPTVLSILQSRNADGFTEDQQSLLEKLVQQSSDLKSQDIRKLADILELKPLQTKHFVAAIQDATRGLGRMGAQDPFIADNSTEHPNAGR